MKVHLALLTVAVLFSANYVISKLGMREFHPLTFAWLRVAASALVLFAIARGEAPIPREDRKVILGFAMLGVVINQCLFLAGLSLTTVPVAAVLIVTIPVFALAAAILLGKERATVQKIGGIALAAIGALLAVGGEGIVGNARSLLGAAMIVLNCLSYALYLVLSKPLMARASPKQVVATMFAMGSVLMLPIAAVPLWRENWSAIPPKAWLALALVIAGPTVAAYLLSAWALRHAESSLVATYTYLQPVMASVLGALFLGEEIHAIVLVAAVLIFGGVWLAGKAPDAPVVE
ncbi:MAG TPA: DMT family transporter [Thermoanaerobaculia bacterium]